MARTSSAERTLARHPLSFELPSCWNPRFANSRTYFGNLGACCEHLPSYSVPSTVHHVETIPRNASGKANGQELAELVAQGKLNAAE